MGFHTNNYGHSGQRKEEKTIKNRLARHHELTQKYIADGMNEEDASKKAYKEVIADPKLAFK